MKVLHSADWHLRLDLPRCRVDSDWLETQRGIVRQIVTLANSLGVPATAAGDIFHTPRVPDEIVSMLIEEAQKATHGIGIIAGNHDLPYHSWDNVSRSSFGIIWNLAVAHQSGFFPAWELGAAANWGQPRTVDPSVADNRVMFLHRLVFKSRKDLPPNVEASTAQDILDEFPDYDWILTGDMHQAFHYVGPDDRHVVNPGCITRQAVDFQDYRPSVYLVDTDAETVKQYFLDDTGEVIDDAYIQAEAERDERIGAFIETVKTSGAVSLDFLANVEKFLQTNELSPETKKAVIKLLEDAK